MDIDEHEFAVPFLKDSGFLRRQCVVCGSHFWTQVPNRETCGDVPCEEYTFIGNSPARQSLSVREARNTFLSFFESRGHRIVCLLYTSDAADE